MAPAPQSPHLVVYSKPSAGGLEAVSWRFNTRRTFMKRFFCSICLLFLCAIYASGQELFEIKPVADGVYAAIAKPAYKLNCNAAIILMGDGVLVVDTHSKPSAARALIAEIPCRAISGISRPGTSLSTVVVPSFTRRCHRSFSVLRE